MLVACTVALVASNKLSVFAQRPAVGRVSAEQRRAVHLVISGTGMSSGSFSRDPIPEKETFTLGEPIHIGLLMTNTGRESIWVCAFSNPYYQNRPQLTRDGEAVGYLENLKELIRQSDAGTLCEFTSKRDIVYLKPNSPLRVPSIELQEWYGTLSPGHYQLFLRRTLACCADGQWISTNTISFDVTD